MDIPIFVWMIIVPLLASPVVYLSAHIGKKQRQSTAQWVALAGLLLTWVPFVLAARDLRVNGSTTFSVGGVMLVFDGLGLLLAAVALGLGTLVVWYSGPYMAGETGQEKYYAMLAAIIGVMIGLGCAGDLFNLWVWFEAMAVSSYLLVTFYREQPASLEAGVKYLIQSASGSVLVLLGIGLVLSQTGTLELSEIRASASGSPLLLAAVALFMIGFGVKAALVPLHTWLPDAHSQAPSGISAMLSGIVIEAGLIAMLRSVSALAVVTPSWSVIFIGFGVLNMLVGNLMALRQKQVKRLLAYSSLVHVGYMLIGLGVALYARDIGGAQGGFFHLVNHGLMKGLAFLAAGALLYAFYISAGRHAQLTVSDLSGTCRRYPVVAFSLSIALLSLGGLPPLAGFMSKWQIFVAGFETHNLLIGAVIVFAALNSVLSLAYYAPMVNSMYKRDMSEVVQTGKSLPVVMTIPLVLLALLVIGIGIWPSALNWLTSAAGASLMIAFGG
jgi:proton-translocating NADH-quinone oxidoreductase chain N